MPKIQITWEERRRMAATVDVPDEVWLNGSGGSSLGQWLLEALDEAWVQGTSVGYEDADFLIEIEHAEECEENPRLSVREVLEKHGLSDRIKPSSEEVDRLTSRRLGPEEELSR
jgi:hypothetical protein